MRRRPRWATAAAPNRSVHHRQARLCRSRYRRGNAREHGSPRPAAPRAARLQMPVLRGLAPDQPAVPCRIRRRESLVLTTRRRRAAVETPSVSTAAGEPENLDGRGSGWRPCRPDRRRPRILRRQDLDRADRTCGGMHLGQRQWGYHETARGVGCAPRGEVAGIALVEQRKKARCIRDHDHRATPSITFRISCRVIGPPRSTVSSSVNNGSDHLRCR